MKTEPLIQRFVAGMMKIAGYKCYLVGGSVRDWIMCREDDINDLDFATNATPEQTTEVFTKAGFKVVGTGLKHGTVSVFLELRSKPIEITTFRKDGEYWDGRRPETVDFVDNVEDDLARRDFTVNAIAYDPTTCTFIDPWEGMADIEAKVIRAVGRPQERFAEDGLRVMRALRLAAQLEFEIEPETWTALTNTYSVEKLMQVSQERIRDELMKGLSGTAVQVAKFLELLSKSDILFEIIPEMSDAVMMLQPPEHHKYDVFRHSVEACKVMALVEEDPLLRLVALLHDIGKPATYSNNDGTVHFYEHEKKGAEIIEQVLNRLHFSREQVDMAKRLVLHHLDFYEQEWTDSRLRRWINKVAIPRYDDQDSGKKLPITVKDVLPQINLALADKTGQGKNWFEMYTLFRVDMVNRIEELLNAKGPLTARDLKFNGHDIMAMGIPAGPRVGEIQQHLLHKVLQQPELNNKEALAQLAQEFMKKDG